MNPAYNPKHKVSEEEYVKDLIDSAIEMVIRKVRWKAVNLSKEAFEDWILNSEVKDFKGAENG